MRSAPAMPLFGDAYMADTRHLSLEEHGAYLSLLMIAWRCKGCALPNDDARIARMLGVTAKKWSRLKPVVMAFWTLTDAGWEQKRLLKERRFVAEKSEQNRAAISARWEAKRLKNNEVDDTNVIPDPYGNDTPPPPPPPFKQEEKDSMPDVSGDYAFFGKTIKLTSRHLKEWTRLFHSIPDIVAELSMIDEWWQQQPPAKRTNWFIATKGMLNKKHQENLATRRDYDPDILYV